MQMYTRTLRRVMDNLSRCAQTVLIHTFDIAARARACLMDARNLRKVAQKRRSCPAALSNQSQCYQISALHTHTHTSI